MFRNFSGVVFVCIVPLNTLHLFGEFYSVGFILLKVETRNLFPRLPSKGFGTFTLAKPSLQECVDGLVS